MFENTSVGVMYDFRLFVGVLNHEVTTGVWKLQL